MSNVMLIYKVADTPFHIQGDDKSNVMLIYKVADTSFHIQGDDMSNVVLISLMNFLFLRTNR